MVDVFDYCAHFRLSDNLSVESDSHFPNHREAQLFVNNRESTMTAMLWVSERGVPLLPFETRMLRQTSEKRAKRFVESEGDILDDLALDLFQILILLPTSRHFPILGEDISVVANSVIQ